MLNRLSVKEMGTNNQKTTHQSQIFAGVSQSLSKPFKRIAGVCFTQVFTESPATLYFSCLQLNIHCVRFGCGVHFSYMSIGPKEVQKDFDVATSRKHDT